MSLLWAITELIHKEIKVTVAKERRLECGAQYS